MNFPRRKFLYLAAGAAALPSAPYIARAQGYPSRPVRIIVSSGPGQNVLLSHSSSTIGQAPAAISPLRWSHERPLTVTRFC